MGNSILRLNTHKDEQQDQHNFLLLSRILVFIIPIQNSPPCKSNKYKTNL